MSSHPEAERVTALINEYKKLDSDLKQILKRNRSDFDSRVVYLVRDINSIKSELRLLGVADVDAFIKEMDAKAVVTKAAETASFPAEAAAVAAPPEAGDKSTPPARKGNTRRAKAVETAQ